MDTIKQENKADDVIHQAKSDKDEAGGILFPYIKIKDICIGKTKKIEAKKTMKDKNIAICHECGKECISIGGTTSTLVFFVSPPGHDHDDNCLVRQYICPNGHITRISKQRRCNVEGCDWKGIEYCSCHPSKKVKEWPEINTDEEIKRLKKGVEQLNLNPTWVCKKCGWKSFFSVNESTLTVAPYIPLHVTGKKCGWVCPDCKTIQ